ncbi:MAG TPA: hypothetical protein VFG14_06425 [Chthoniobacteraceae bacterium]|nr:hypothetical protein [Chthoniobacteraceae bacterium]
MIRSLMEKATIYRALSAPAALVGGILSLGTAAFLMWHEINNGPNEITSNFFGMAWAVVFVATAGISLLLIQRDAKRRGEPFLSIGFRSAMTAMLPPMSFAALITLAHTVRNTIHYTVPWWITFYGLALLAMAHFAPRSIIILGWAFLVSGAASVGGLLDFWFGSRLQVGDHLPEFINGPCVLMGATFGLFHLVYAACTWPRRR